MSDFSTYTQPRYVCNKDVNLTSATLSLTQKWLRRMKRSMTVSQNLIYNQTQSVRFMKVSVSRMTNWLMYSNLFQVTYWTAQKWVITIWLVLTYLILFLFFFHVWHLYLHTVWNKDVNLTSAFLSLTQKWLWRMKISVFRLKLTDANFIYVFKLIAKWHSEHLYLHDCTETGHNYLILLLF